MITLLRIKLTTLCIALTIVLIQICYAAPHAHKKANLPAFCHSQNVGTQPGCGKTPTATFDNNDRLWVVYIDGKHIKLSYSTDNANSFEKAITINPVPENIYADGENRPKITFGLENEIYISWVNKTEGRYTGDIRFSRSLDNAKTFSAPITVNDDGLLTSHRFDTLAVGPDGRIHLTWLDKRDLLAAKEKGKKYVGAALYHAVSTDKGTTFSRNRKISDNSCECCRISIVFNKQGHAIALWRHVFKDMIRDHAIFNLDNTEIKRDINRVTFDNWQIEACPHHGPDMAIDNQDNLHLSWFTGIPGKGGLFYGRYNQATNKLEQQFNIDSSSTASRPQILVHGKQILYVWKVLEQEQTKLQLKISNDNGDNWSDTTTLTTTTGMSDHPLLFSNGNKAYVSWWSEVEGFQLIPLRDNIEIENKAISLLPFNKESLFEIEEKHKKTDFLFVLWSLECPPRIKELEYLGTLIKQKKMPKLLLVSTDTSEFIPEIKSTLKQFGLEHEENWYFNTVPELLRSRIDKNWFGELPRTYFYKTGEKRLAHSGALTKTILEKWSKLNR